jgi:hypothetical protein
MYLKVLPRIPPETVAIALGKVNFSIGLSPVLIKVTLPRIEKGQ